MGVNDFRTPIDHKNHMNGLEMDLSTANHFTLLMGYFVSCHEIFDPCKTWSSVVELFTFQVVYDNVIMHNILNK